MTLDWPAWDRRFGPLLDGSAFADLPRRRVPVECFYLPLFENWPSPMEGNYNGDYWADRAFPESYRRAFVTAARQIAAHFAAKGWTETLFQGFLNNKNNFKARGWSRGSSPWLLDEPANFQDYWALRYFARAFHEGINQAARDRAGSRSAAVPTRSSASSPSAAAPGSSSEPTSRDRSGGEIASTACSTIMSSAAPCETIRISSPSESDASVKSCSNTARPTPSRARTFSRWGGASMSGAWGRWRHPLADRGNVGIMGPRRRAGVVLSGMGESRTARSSAGLPIPSIRLKAYRRGQQDVEYLALWSSLHKEPRWSVGSQVRAALKLAGTRQATGTTDAEDAGRIDYARLHARDVWALRTAIGEALSQAHPAFQPRLVDLRAPRRDPDHLPEFRVEK